MPISHWPTAAGEWSVLAIAEIYALAERAAAGDGP
jgi:hypothetical protein